MTNIHVLDSVAEIARALIDLTELASLRRSDKDNSLDTYARLNYAIMSMKEASLYLERVLEDAGYAGEIPTIGDEND